jgi:hypothetical protein
MGRSWFQSSPGKKEFAKPHLKRKKLSIVVHPCHPAKVGSIKQNGGPG